MSSFGGNHLSYYYLWDSVPQEPISPAPPMFPFPPYQVTVTDEESQSQVELDFRSDNSDQLDDDPFSDSYIERRGKKSNKGLPANLTRQDLPLERQEQEPKEEEEHYLRQTRRRRLQPLPPSARRRNYSPPLSSGSSIRSSRATDSGFSQQSVISSMKSFAIGRPETNVYGSEAANKKNDRDETADVRRSHSRQSTREESPPGRPSWGFGPSRAQSRMEEGYLNGYESPDSDDANYINDDDDDYDYGYKSGRQRNNKSSTSRMHQTSTSKSRSRSRLSTRGAKTRVTDDLDKHRAVKVTLYKNGDPWFGSMEYRFLPGRDVNNLDGLFEAVNKKMDFLNGISHLFDTDGSRITGIDQVCDGGEYVCSSSRKFVVANYGKTGDDFQIDGGPSRSQSRMNRVPLYNYKKSAAQTTKPGSGDGRIIRIINAMDDSIRERVLLNLKTSQAFEDVVADLGQVLKISKADRLYTKRGKEIRSFSHLKMDFMNENTFFVSAGPARINRYISDEEEEYEEYDDEYSLKTSSMHRSSSEPNLSSSRHKSPSRNHRRKNSDDASTIKIKIRGRKHMIYPPSSGLRHNTARPSERLETDWVYGYRGKREDSNLWLLRTGELLYYVGSIAVVYSRLGDSQRHYDEHTEDIQCMAIHPTRDFVASGQKAGRGSEHRAHIRVWSTLDMDTKAIVGDGELDRGVSGLAFSTLNRGAHLMCVDGGKDAQLSIWVWDGSKNGAKELLGRTSTGAPSSIYGCVFHPLDDTLHITFGRGHLVFWNRRRDGFFESTDVLKKGDGAIVITCVTFLDSGDLVAGDADGNVRTYTVSEKGEYYVCNEFEAHRKGGVNCLLMLNEHLLVTGGGDRTLVTWDATREYNKMRETRLGETLGAPITITPQQVEKSSGDSNLYVGTTANVILEGNMTRGFNVLVWGHSDEIVALAAHPDDLGFVTVGIDKVVARWKKQKVAWKLTVPTRCLCADYHPGGNFVVVGADDGHLVSLNGDNGAHATTVKTGGSALVAVVFSPDGNALAVATDSGTVFIYAVLRKGAGLRRHVKIGGPPENIRCADFSKSGNFVRTLTSDFDLTHWDVRKARVESDAEEARDEEWPSATCPLAFYMAGAWNNANYSNDDSEVTAAALSSGGSFVAAGDSDGFVRLFRAPCPTPRAEFREKKAWTGEVRALRFVFDEIYLVGVGGRKKTGDSTLVRWKIK